jgi:hypothetical protein
MHGAIAALEGGLKMQAQARVFWLGVALMVGAMAVSRAAGHLNFFPCTLSHGSTTSRVTRSLPPAAACSR